MHVQDHRWFEDAGHNSNARSPHHYLPGQAQQWRNASRVPRTARGSHESMGCCFLRHPGETIHGRWERGMVIHIQLHVLRGARQQDVERHAVGGRQCNFQSSPRRPAHAAAAPRSLAVPCRRRCRPWRRGASARGRKRVGQNGAPLAPR